MTPKEYISHRAEISRRTLTELLAKVEAPFGDDLTDILLNCINQIDVLRERIDEGWYE